MNTLINKFLKKKSANKYSEHTLDAYRRDLTTFFVFLSTSEKNYPNTKSEARALLSKLDIEGVDLGKLTSITDDDITDYLDFLDIFENSISTKNRRLSCLKEFYKYLVKVYKIDNPFDDIELLKDIQNKKPKFLEDIEIEDIYKLIPKNNHYYRDKFVITCVLHSGLRVSELHSLTTDSINNGIMYVLGKGKKIREIPMNKSLSEAYNNYLMHKDSSDKQLFNVTIRTLQRVVKKYVKQIGRGDITIHDLRHTFATRLVSKGVDIETIREFMGHSDIRTTQIYFHTNEERRNKAVNMLD